MGDPSTEQRTPAAATALAFAVHVFTACGAALALLALAAAVERDWSLMFLMLGLALIVDGVDGTLARHLRVSERLPRWSGDTLDLVVDFTTYVFVPAFAIAAGGLLPPLVAWPAGIAIVISGALYFADRDMKMAGNYFRGFPALWNLAAFYLFLLRPGPWAALVVVVVMVVAQFLRFPFVHPFRVARLRIVTLALAAVWAVLAAVTLSRGMMPPLWITAVLCVIGLYFLGAGFLRRSP